MTEAHIFPLFLSKNVKNVEEKLPWEELIKIIWHFFRTSSKHDRHQSHAWSFPHSSMECQFVFWMNFLLPFPTLKTGARGKKKPLISKPDDNHLFSDNSSIKVALLNLNLDQGRWIKNCMLSYFTSMEMMAIMTCRLGI